MHRAYQIWYELLLKMKCTKCPLGQKLLLVNSWLRSDSTKIAILWLYLHCFSLHCKGKRRTLFLSTGWSGRCHRAVDRLFNPSATNLRAFSFHGPRGEQGHSVRSHFNKRERDTSRFQRADTDQIPSPFISLLLPPSYPHNNSPLTLTISHFYVGGLSQPNSEEDKRLKQERKGKKHLSSVLGSFSILYFYTCLSQAFHSSRRFRRLRDMRHQICGNWIQIFCVFVSCPPPEFAWFHLI